MVDPEPETPTPGDEDDSENPSDESPEVVEEIPWTQIEDTAVTVVPGESVDESTVDNIPASVTTGSDSDDVKVEMEGSAESAIEVERATSTSMNGSSNASEGSQSRADSVSQAAGPEMRTSGESVNKAAPVGLATLIMGLAGLAASRVLRRGKLH